MMSPSSITLHHLVIPLARPFATTTNQVSEIHALLTEVTLSNGLIAQSFIYGLGKVPISEVMSQFTPALLSDINHQKAWTSSESWKKYWAELRKKPTTPVLQYFISALDVTAWDYFAKQAKMPLHRLLGSTVSQVPLYGTTGWLSLSTEELILEAQKYASQGINALKVRSPHPQDQTRIAALRQAMGPDFKIMIDATAYLNLEEALQLAKDIAPYDITWLEEPLRNMEADLKPLCEATTIPIAAGENFLSESEFEHYAKKNQLQIYQIDLKRMGGVTGFMNAGHILRGKMPVSNHLMPELCASLISVFPNTTLAEYDDLLPAEIFTHPPVIQEGCLQLSDVPGSGVSITAEAIEKYSISMMRL